VHLNPGSSDALAWHGVYLAMMGRLDDSIGELERARRLDPVSLFINNALGLPMYLAGRYDDAIAQARKTLDLDPNYYFARIGLGTALAEKGELAEAIAEFERARQLDDSPEILAFLARAHALAGDRGQARRLLGELHALKRPRYVSPYDIALVHCALGEKGQALRALEKAYETRAEGMVSLKLDPRLATLRGEPAFQKLAGRMNFPR
jgi:tetratricopeptide (TPR) repeat protein